VATVLLQRARKMVRPLHNFSENIQPVCPSPRLGSSKLVTLPDRPSTFAPFPCFLKIFTELQRFPLLLDSHPSVEPLTRVPSLLVFFPAFTVHDLPVASGPSWIDFFFSRPLSFFFILETVGDRSCTSFRSPFVLFAP